MRRVLIIDDELDVVDLVSLNLRKEGRFTISSAVDGAVGLQKAREEFPNLIILDLMLPGISGFEIILSAKAAADDRIRGFELGADDYVTKPFSSRELVLRIQRAGTL